MLDTAGNGLGPGPWQLWLQLLRTQLFPSQGVVVISPKAAVYLVCNAFKIPCVPLVQHCLIKLLLT